MGGAAHAERAPEALFSVGGHSDGLCPSSRKFLKHVLRPGNAAHLSGKSTHLSTRQFETILNLLCSFPSLPHALDNWRMDE